MIEYLKNDEIDREKWDNCIRNTRGAKPYGYSWFLDIMSPGWEALTDDDYDAVFPLPLRTKYGIKYLTTPAFVQQLGAFTPDNNPVQAIDEFLGFLPQFYRLIDMGVGQRISYDHFSASLRANYELDLSRSYDKIYDGFNQHCRRNVDKALKKKLQLVDDITPDELVTLFRNNRGEDIKKIQPLDYQRLKDLITYCINNKRGRIIGVRKSAKKILYGLFVLEVKGIKTMLLVVNTPESREKRIGYYVINELIRESASTKTILDFAGSSIPSIASFMESFGSVNRPYYRIYSNRLPWPISLLK